MSDFKTGALVMCKGGTPNPLHRQFAGTVHRIGECVGINLPGRGCLWVLEPPTIAGTLNLIWSQQYLRLLDDPGEDARDETMTWLPVPTREGALA